MTNQLKVVYVCNVPAESERAQVLKQACPIVWDEIVMSGKYSPEAFDLTLTDLMHNDKPVSYTHLTLPTKA